MPKGLTNFMTQDELLDLVRFLWELGRPGGRYQRNTAPIFRTWRALVPNSGPLAEGVPDAETFAAQVLAPDKSSGWRTVYSLVSGAVPLEELVDAKSPGVVYLQTDVEVKAGGQVGFQLDAVDGTSVWIDDQPVSPAEKMTTGLTPGRHTVTLRIDPAQRKNGSLTLQLFRPADSTTEAHVVGGG